MGFKIDLEVKDLSLCFLYNYDYETPLQLVSELVKQSAKAKECFFLGLEVRADLVPATTVSRPVYPRKSVLLHRYVTIP